MIGKLSGGTKSKFWMTLRTLDLGHWTLDLPAKPNENSGPLE
jgi:hypothetical protein